MERFEENLDGFYDVENQIPRYLRELAAERFEAERTHKESIRTIDAHERHANRMRAVFLEAIGGLPDERTPLNAERTGTLDRDGYSIETIIYESLPNLHVTGNCYRPHGEGPFPAVLFLCGHAVSGKAAALYQRACVELAENGFLVLAIDPIGQGERVQSYDPETGDIPRATIREHTYLGHQCQLAGSNLSRYLVWDAIRALDYLEERRDVDGSRLGATGNSGGGMQTGFLMLVDDRLDAAVPCCFVTSREEYMKTGQAQDGEQILPGAIERGLNYDDFLSAFAPKPVLIGSARSDFLCIEGTERSFERARRVYDVYGASENVDLVVADDTHGLSAPLREAMVNWFREHLRDEAPTFETTVGTSRVEDEVALCCTGVGQVHGEYPDETHVVDLNRAYVRERHGEAGRVPRPDDLDEYGDRLRETVVERFDLDRPRAPLHPRRIETERDAATGVRWEKVFFYSEPDVIVAGILAVAIERPDEITPTVLLSDHGTEMFDEHETRLASLAHDRGFAMAFDPRGVGAVQARDVNTPLANGGEYFDYHGTEYKLASDALMLGTSVFGMRVYDVLRAREYLADRVERADAGETSSRVEGYGLDGIGVGAFYALVAAAAEPRFRTIRIESLPCSFYERATNREFDIDFRLHTHDVVGVCDVPQLLPALADRDITWEGTDPDRFR